MPNCKVKGIYVKKSGKSRQCQKDQIFVGRREAWVLEKLVKSTDPDTKKTIISRLVAANLVWWRWWPNIFELFGNDECFQRKTNCKFRKFVSWLFNTFWWQNQLIWTWRKSLYFFKFKGLTLLFPLGVSWKLKREELSVERY